MMVFYWLRRGVCEVFVDNGLPEMLHLTCFRSESHMMIPGTYAQMLKDYD